MNQTYLRWSVFIFHGHWGRVTLQHLNIFLRNLCHFYGFNK